MVGTKNKINLISREGISLVEDEVLRAALDSVYQSRAAVVSPLAMKPLTA